MNWLTDELKDEIRLLFEPKYHRKLSDLEVIEIAQNLTEVMEAWFKLKWRGKYGDDYSRSITR